MLLLPIFFTAMDERTLDVFEITRRLDFAVSSFALDKNNALTGTTADGLGRTIDGVDLN
jgi:hypothetical protein